MIYVWLFAFVTAAMDDLYWVMILWTYFIYDYYTRRDFYIKLFITTPVEVVKRMYFNFKFIILIFKEFINIGFEHVLFYIAVVAGAKETNFNYEENAYFKYWFDHSEFEVSYRDYFLQKE